MHRHDISVGIKFKIIITPKYSQDNKLLHIKKYEICDNHVISVRG